MCQKKLECLQLFSAAGRKQSQVKYKHTATSKNAQEEHRSVHRPVFTLRQRGYQSEQAENVLAGRKRDQRGGI